MTSRLVDGGWASEFEEALGLDGGELLIVSPFIKSGALAKLLASPPCSCRVVTRFNLEDFASGVSDTTALQELLGAGAVVRGVRHLHAKLYVFGASRAIITSANLTGAGIGRNHELGIVTGEGGVVAACRQYFERLWAQAGPDLTAGALANWDAEVTGRLTCGGRLAASDRLKDHGVDIGLPWIPEHPEASAFDGRSQALVKFLGQGSDRASLSRAVLEELEGAGCHWALAYPTKRRPRSVRDGAVMFISRLVEGDDIRVFGRGIGLAHQSVRDDATEEDIELRPWKSRWGAYIRVHDTEFVNGTLANGVSLGELMDTLGARCFASTSGNAVAGGGNTNPRLAIRRHAAVELTEEGAVWLRRELEQRFKEHGKVKEATLRRLDWPVVPDTRKSS